MLQEPENQPSGTIDKPPPCYRCLFEKPISDYWCQPETCDMLEWWLTDSEYSWKKYLFGWQVSIELKAVKKNELNQEF